MAFEGARQDVISQAQNQPQTQFLWVGVAPTDLPKNIEQTSIDSLENNAQYDVVIVDCLISEKRDKSRQILSQLRDIIAKKIIIFYHDKALSAQDFIDLGFIQLSKEEAIYGFDLYNYRQTPDWLNSDNWANPERFDKERW